MSNLNVQSVTSILLLKYIFLCDEYIFCESLLPCATLSLLSHRQCFLANMITQCVTSFWFFLMYTFSCLNHIFLLFLLLLASVQSLSHWQCLLPHPTHHHKCHLSTADTPTTQQNNTSHKVNISTLLLPCCPPAAPCCQPLPSLATRCLPRAAQRWCWPSPLNAWAVIRLWSVRSPLSKQNKIR